VWLIPGPDRFIPTPPEIDPVPIAQEAVWAQITRVENIAPTGIWSPDVPARCVTLYRLSYVGLLYGALSYGTRISSYCRKVCSVLRKLSIIWNYRGIFRFQNICKSNVLNTLTKHRQTLQIFLLTGASQQFLRAPSAFFFLKRLILNGFKTSGTTINFHLGPINNENCIYYLPDCKICTFAEKIKIRILLMQYASLRITVPHESE
jgi:hypothetical protein